MRSFQEKLEEFEKRGVRLVAISVDPPDVTKPHIDKQGFTFQFLCDPELIVILQYDLLHEKGRRSSEDIARPAEFLLDSSGTVRWRNLTENYRTRPKADDILKVIEDLNLKGGKSN